MQTWTDRPVAGDRVAVVRLKLRDFRCHRNLQIACEPRSVVLLGANGSGKTSVLEALSLLGPGRGLRQARLGDLLSRSEDHAGASWSVATRVRGRYGASDVAASYTPGAAGVRERRSLVIDGQPVRSHAALADVISLVWLTPEMDRLFVEGPAARRRFLDRIVFGLDTAHAQRVAAFGRAMQQRAALLREPRPDPAWAAALEEEIAASGTAIAVARRQVAAMLSEQTAAAPGPFPHPQIATAGILETWLDDMPALAAEEQYRQHLKTGRGEDAKSGGTGLGPHRSNVLVAYRETGRLAADCSTGEQKMLLIGLVLAAARLLEGERATGPILLLDEVVAHLDRHHREAAFAAVEELGVQAWYAGTEPSVFAPLLESHAQVVSLERASVQSAGLADVDASTGGEPE